MTTTLEAKYIAFRDSPSRKVHCSLAHLLNIRKESNQPKVTTKTKTKILRGIKKKGKSIEFFIR